MLPPIYHERRYFMRPKKKYYILLIVITLLLFLGLIFGLSTQMSDSASAILTIETPQKVSLAAAEPLTLAVTISGLGDVRYPAMSASISFDASRLEFLGLDDGNVFVHDDNNTTGQKLPEWSCNVEQSNKTGQINLIYLDLSGGKYAFDTNLLSEDDNILFRLKFRLRGSVRAGDVCELIIEDAVFAASDETQSLATTTGTLKVKNSKIVITGE